MSCFSVPALPPNLTKYTHTQLLGIAFVVAKLIWEDLVMFEDRILSFPGGYWKFAIGSSHSLRNDRLRDPQNGDPTQPHRDGQTYQHSKTRSQLSQSSLDPQQSSRRRIVCRALIIRIPTSAHLPRLQSAGMYFLTWIGLVFLWIAIWVSETRITRKRASESAEEWENYVGSEETKKVFVVMCGVLCLVCYGGGHIPSSTRRDSIPMAIWAGTGILYILYEMARQMRLYSSLVHSCRKPRMGKKSALAVKVIPDETVLRAKDFQKPSSVHDLELLIGIALFVSVTETLLLVRDNNGTDIEGAGIAENSVYHWTVWALFISEKWCQVWILSLVSAFYVEPWRNNHLLTASHFYLVMAFYNVCCWISSLAFAFRSFHSSVAGDTGTKMVAVIYVALIIKFRMLSAIVFWQQYSRQPSVSAGIGEYIPLADGQIRANTRPGEDMKRRLPRVNPKKDNTIDGILAHFHRAVLFSVGSILGMFVGQSLFILAVLFFFFTEIGPWWYACPIVVNTTLLLAAISFFLTYGLPLRTRVWNERLVLCMVGILASIGYLMAGGSVLGNIDNLSVSKDCFSDEFLDAHGMKRGQLDNRLWWNCLNLIFRGFSLLVVSVFYYSFQPDNFWWRLLSRKSIEPKRVSLVLSWSAFCLPYMLWGTLGLLIEEGIEQEATIVMKAAACTIDFWEGLWEAVAPVALGFRFLLLSHFLGMSRCFQEKWCGAHKGFHHEPEHAL
ncbi:hypothetical protein AAMO2058_000473100 [Amorphochlora amoebiformis]